MIIELVRRDERVLTSRQLGVYLACYDRDGNQTPGQLVRELSMPKSSITRALKVLEGRNLVRRRIDWNDLRSVTIERTTDGYALLEHMRRVAAD
jgi:DNA-binding MarR family transcriptional regulator